MRRVVLLSVVLVALVVSSVRAQPIRHLDEAFTPRDVRTLPEWLGRADSLRSRILAVTGLLPLPERTPLQPRLGPTIERDDYEVRTVVLETRPGFFLTGNLYRPLEGTGPFPAVLSAHGHWAEGRFEHGELASVPGRAVQLARMGFVVFSYSMIGYNETADFWPHRFDDPRFELWGFSAMGLQLWNGIRALDFVSELPYVDPDRIAMTGASGGGTQTFMLTAVDSRIRAAAPVNMVSAFMQGGCVCENAPLLRLKATNVDIAALAAPRPLLLVSTSGDWTANTPEVEYPAVRSIYRLFGAEDRIANVHLDYPHNYNRDSREAVYAWFSQWLLGREGAVEEGPLDVADDALLRADVPPHARELETLFGDYVLESMRRIEEARPTSLGEIFDYRERFGRTFAHVLDVDVAPGQVEAYLPDGRTEAGPAVLFVSADTSRAAAAAGELLANDRALFTLDPHPDVFLPPDSIDHWTTYNATTAARRVAQIRAAIEYVAARPDVTTLDVVAVGAAGPWTLLARALVSNGVGRTFIDFDGFDVDDDRAYLDRLFVPLLRRAGDFRTAAVLSVPAPLHLSGLASPDLRQWIEDVYDAAGAGEMLVIE